MRLIYTQDWSADTGGWSAETSKAKTPTVPTRISVNHPLAEYAMYFAGNGGWAIGTDVPPVKDGGSLEIRFRAYICSSGRNSLSLNVRDKRGTAVYKYSFGEQRHVWANRQPAVGSVPHQQMTKLEYECNTPYELISRHVVGSGEFQLSLTNLLTGVEETDASMWQCSGNGEPAMLDFDQEGGTARAYLGQVEVWAL